MKTLAALALGLCLLLPNNTPVYAAECETVTKSDLVAAGADHGYTVSTELTGTAIIQFMRALTETHGQELSEENIELIKAAIDTLVIFKGTGQVFVFSFKDECQQGQGSFDPDDFDIVMRQVERNAKNG